MTHLPYETAAALKAAGYPQDTEFEWGYINRYRGIERRLRGRNLAKDDDAVCAAPTLGELVAACGKGFGSLEREDEGPEDGGVQWIAFRAGSDDDGGTGSTPEIATARLWLALNGKK
jgi:hypothetical protein